MPNRTPVSRGRREFLKAASFAAGSLLLPRLAWSSPRLAHSSPVRRVTDIGIQLYSVRTEMLADAVGTLKRLAQIGFKELESARSEKGNYYGLKPKEIRSICAGLGMTLR